MALTSIFSRLHLLRTAPVTLWTKYTHALKTRPFATNAITTGCLSLGADFVAQRIEQSEEANFEVDPSRSATMFSFGVLSAPPAVLWFRVLDRLFPPTPTVPLVIGKILVNQAVWSPFINSSFFGFVSFSQHGATMKAMRHYEEKMRNDFFTTWSRALQFWGCANFINFMFLPGHLRILYMNGVAAVWTCYLSYVGFKGKPAALKGSDTRERIGGHSSSSP